MQRKYTLLIVCIGTWIMGHMPEMVYAKTKHRIPDSLQVLHFQVGDIMFDMQRVEGGLFVMGGTREQHRDILATDLPTHTVSLDAYYIATTEVTQALWEKVMQDWYMNDEWHTPNHPITDVSWYDCQVFIYRLDSITGMPFRLPTEAEWEFAARGGNETQGFRFAGGNILDSVSWGLSNGGFRKHTVGLKKPNELGLYDMTGNVSEWCSDWYAPYYIGTEPNPKGPITGDNKIVRGGSFDNCQANSHISYRHYQRPEESTQYCGLRLAMTLPNEPTLQVTEEPTIVKRLKLKNMKIKLVYVAAEIPYYISEEPITHRVWNKVMDSDNVDNWSEAMVDKTEDEWNIYLEKIERLPESVAAEIQELILGGAQKCLPRRYCLRNKQRVRL